MLAVTRMEKILATVPTTPGKFEYAALCPRSVPPSTLIRHENGAFRKCSSNRRNLKTRALRFDMDEKHFENEDIVISSPEFSSDTNPK